MAGAMRQAEIRPLPTGAERSRRRGLAIAARRRLEEAPPRGRAWIHGREVGGADPRYAHLGRGHD